MTGVLLPVRSSTRAHGVDAGRRELTGYLRTSTALLLRISPEEVDFLFSAALHLAALYRLAGRPATDHGALARGYDRCAGSASTYSMSLSLGAPPGPSVAEISASALQGSPLTSRQASR